MRAPRSSLDLLAAIALALAGLGAALVPLDTWIRVVLLAPLVLVVSGYAILAALLPEEQLSPGERLVYAVALSLAATTIGGIAVQLALDLERTAWALLLAVLTIGASLVALRRRSRRRKGEPNASVRRPFTPPGLLSSLAVVVAVAIAAVAVAISSAGAKRERDGYEFTALWAQPAEAATGTGPAVRIGVENHQGATARYRLVVKQGPATIVHRKLLLPNAGSFGLRVPAAPITPSDPVVVSLYRGGEVFRHVYLEHGKP